MSADRVAQHSSSKGEASPVRRQQEVQTFLLHRRLRGESSDSSPIFLSLGSSFAHPSSPPHRDARFDGFLGTRPARQPPLDITAHPSRDPRLRRLPKCSFPGPWRSAMASTRRLSANTPCSMMEAPEFCRDTPSPGGPTLQTESTDRRDRLFRYLCQRMMKRLTRHTIPVDSESLSVAHSPQGAKLPHGRPAWAACSSRSRT